MKEYLRQIRNYMLHQRLIEPVSQVACGLRVLVFPFKAENTSQFYEHVEALHQHLSVDWRSNIAARQTDRSFTYALKDYVEFNLTENDRSRLVRGLEAVMADLTLQSKVSNSMH